MDLSDVKVTSPPSPLPDLSSLFMLNILLAKISMQLGKREECSVAVKKLPVISSCFCFLFNLLFFVPLFFVLICVFTYHHITYDCFPAFYLLNSVFPLSKMLDKKNIYRHVILILILILIRFYEVRVSISLCCPSSILMYLRFSMSTDGSLPFVVTPCLSHYFIILISCLSRSDVFILTFRDASSQILIHL